MNKSTQKIIVYVILAAAILYGWKAYQSKKAGA